MENRLFQARKKTFPSVKSPSLDRSWSSLPLCKVAKNSPLEDNLLQAKQSARLKIDTMEWNFSKFYFLFV